MYSTIPWADPNLDHTHFYIGLIFYIAISGIYGLILKADGATKSTIKKSTIGSYIVLNLITAYVSFFVEIEKPKNDIVIGELVGFDERVAGGKYKPTENYVTYELPGNELVSFKMGSGQAFPKTAVLYKK